MRVLIVEDEGAIRHALGRGLERAGHVVALGATLAEARERAVEHRPDVLVTDLKLPDGNGLDVAEELGVPFVAMSGYANFDDAVRALQLGCVDFFTKPVAIQAVRKRLEQVALRQVQGRWTVIAGHGTIDRIGPASAGWSHEPIHLWQSSWSDGDQARACYDSYLQTAQQADAATSAATDAATDAAATGAAGDGGCGIEILAELLQAAPCGALTVNRGAGWWAACLDATVDWNHPDLSDRRRYIEHLTDRCILRCEGALVEVCRG
jgi:CheY-like chemotaxis protein